MKNLIAALTLLALFTTLNSEISIAHAQGTAFAYQGQLQNSGAPANGTYDFSFTLYATNLTGAPIAGPVTNTTVGVTNGLFATTIDFGDVYAGESNWLEIAVSTNDANAFVTLAPRQQLLPVPYAITAANLSGIVSSAQLPSTVITNGATGVSLSGAFSGNGSGLTSISPSALPYIVLTNNESAVTLGGTFSGNGSGLYSISPNALPTDVLTNNESNVYLYGTFSGNGSGLYSISPNALPTDVLTNNESNVYLYGTFSGNGSGLYSISPNALPTDVLTNNESNVYLYGTFSGNGSGLYSISPNALPTDVLTNNESNVYLYGTFSGNGSGLYSISPDALPTDVLTNNESNVYLYGTFSGDGSGLYSISPDALPTNVLTNNESNVYLYGTFSGDGSGLTSLNAANLSGTIRQTNIGSTNSFTPTIGNGSANFTTTTQSGYYAKVGNMVYFEIWMVWTNKGSATSGNLAASLPPVPVASSRAVFNVGYVNGITVTGQLLALANAGDFNVTMYVYNAGSSAVVPVSDCSTDGELQITGTYRSQ